MKVKYQTISLKKNKFEEHLDRFLPSGYENYGNMMTIYCGNLQRDYSELPFVEILWWGVKYVLFFVYFYVFCLFAITIGAIL